MTSGITAKVIDGKAKLSIQQISVSIMIIETIVSVTNKLNAGIRPFTLYLVFAKGLALQLNANDFKCAALTSIDITLESIPPNEKKLFFSSDEYSFALVILQSPHTSSQTREAFSVSLLCTRSSCFHLNSENYKFFFPLSLGVFFYSAT